MGGLIIGVGFAAGYIVGMLAFYLCEWWFGW